MIYRVCEGRIVKPFSMITVWQQEAFGVMKMCNGEGLILLFYPHTNNKLFLWLNIDCLV